jgi:D-ribulokinase
MAGMSAMEKVHHPAGSEIERIHRRRYDAFTRLQSVAREIRKGQV